MKKIILVLSVCFAAVTYGYGYSNNVDLYYSGGGGSSPSQSVYANIFSTCEFQFSVSATAPYAYMGSCGSVGVKQGSTVLEYVSLSRYANDPTSIGYTNTRTGYWSQLQLAFDLCGDNLIVYTSLRW